MGLYIFIHSINGVVLVLITGTNSDKWDELTHNTSWLFIYIYIVIYIYIYIMK